MVHAAGQRKVRERKKRQEVQGLTIAKALSADGIEEVECLLYPGDGQVVITGATVRDSSMQTCPGQSCMENDGRHGRWMCAASLFMSQYP